MESGAGLSDQVREIVIDTLALEENEVNDDLSQDSCGQWTSLRHMTLLVALEERLGLAFSMEEMVAMTSLPKILATVQAHAQ